MQFETDNQTEDDGIPSTIIEMTIARESNRFGEMVLRVNKHLIQNHAKRTDTKKKIRDSELEEQKIREAAEILNNPDKIPLNTEDRKKEREQIKVKANLANIGHVDANGIKFKISYDRFKNKGDDYYGQDQL